MAEYLAQTYQIDVITGFPYYPEWEIHKTYKNKPAFITEKKENITLYRYKQYVPKNPTFKTRILHLLDFTVGSIRNIFKIKKSDLVICIVPFTSTIALGLFLAKLRGAKVWVHIQDFEFDAAVESGLTGEENWLKRKIFNGLFQLEKILLNKSDIISTISYGMINKLKRKTDTETYFFPNWVDEYFIDPKKSKQHDFMKADTFKILYSGNIGAKQDWDFFIKVTDYFQDNKQIEFIVVGAGAKKEWLLQKTHTFTNIRHYMPVEYATLPNLLCSADLHILFQKNDVIDTVMPSKLLGMMASAKPSLLTGNIRSEVAKVFEVSHGGYFYDSNSFKQVVTTIKELSIDKTERIRIGKNARHYITEHYSAEKVLGKFKEKIKEVIHN